MNPDGGLLPSENRKVTKSMSSLRPRAARRGAVCAAVPGGGVILTPPPAIWSKATSASKVSLSCVFYRIAANEQLSISDGARSLPGLVE